MSSISNSSTYILGRKTVHRMGFGAMQLPGKRVFGPPRDRDQALAVLRRVADAGVDHIDTAQFYGPDVANELIHAALHPYPSSLAIVSKVGARRDKDGGWLPAQTPAELRAGVEENLRTLDVAQVDVVNLRIHDEPSHDDEPPEVSFDDQLAEMVAMRDDGLIGSVGLSTVTLAQLDHALDGGLDVACVQNAYNLAGRSGAAVLERCEERQIAFVPYFPLGSAFSASNPVLGAPAVTATAARLGVTPSQVALAWLLQHSPNVLLIPGTSSLAHLEENLAVTGVALDARAVEEIDAVDGAGARS